MHKHTRARTRMHKALELLSMTNNIGGLVLEDACARMQHTCARAFAHAYIHARMHRFVRKGSCLS